MDEKLVVAMVEAHIRKLREALETTLREVCKAQLALCATQLENRARGCELTACEDEMRGHYDSARAERRCAEVLREMAQAFQGK